ncbi:hypothetical protein KUTeg_004016 [Tegillarca granosa]|uniref:Uncharacterized protein n=1 Tax=Tegillarca granosa TaxID=220873 RepID=A0ABQ9FRL2_TEGGR|nr:hypothetical protein KUTeg_004016 [Tegillarca granosa]
MYLLCPITEAAVCFVPGLWHVLTVPYNRDPSCRISISSSARPFLDSSSTEQTTVVHSISNESQDNELYKSWVFWWLIASVVCNIGQFMIYIVISCVLRKKKRTKPDGEDNEMKRSELDLMNYKADSGVDDSCSNSPHQQRRVETVANDVPCQTDTALKTTAPTFVSNPVKGVQETTPEVVVSGS